MMIRYQQWLALVVLAGCFPSEGSAGMDFDLSGHLVVSRVWTNELLVLDADTGEVLERLRDGISAPDDVAVDAAGQLFFTSPFSDRVSRVRPGEPVTALGSARGANAITFDQRGRLWVAGCFLGEDLYEFSPDGTSPPRVVAEGLGRDCALNGMVPGADGRLYGAQPTLGRVVAVDPDSGALEVVVTGVGPRAYAVAFLPSGELLVLREGEVALIDRDHKTFSQWAALPLDGDNLLVRQSGEVFVSSATTGEVIALEAGGAGRTVLAGTNGRSFGATP